MRNPKSNRAGMKYSCFCCVEFVFVSFITFPNYLSLFSLLILGLVRWLNTTIFSCTCKYLHAFTAYASSFTEEEDFLGED